MYEGSHHDEVKKYHNMTIYKFRDHLCIWSYIVDMPVWVHYYINVEVDVSLDT